MKLNPKIQDAIRVIEAARPDFVAVLREVGQQTDKAPPQPKRSRARRAGKPVATKKPA